MKMWVPDITEITIYLGDEWTNINLNSYVELSLSEHLYSQKKTNKQTNKS